MRPSKRKNDQIRDISIQTDISNNAEGSCLIKFGNTHVLCTATIDSQVPSFLRNGGTGWVTAEYSMLPRATHTRVRRDSSIGRISARSQEIQRLIGRSLRAVVDLKMLGERQIIIDCDVINADGGTRTAAITGSYIALHKAINHAMQNRILRKNPLQFQLAAISCGVYKGEVIVDLDYEEDSNAEVDANFVFNSAGGLIEVQATAEEQSFTQEQLMTMLTLAKSATQKLFALQNQELLKSAILK